MLAEICTKKSLTFYEETFFKEIMKRSRNEYSELNFSKIELIKRQYSKQGNSRVSLVRRSKKLYYSNLDGEKVTDNKTF